MLYEYYLQTYRANTRGPTGPKKSQPENGNRRKWMKKSAYQRMTRKVKKRKINLIYNYSSITLTPGMESYLFKGLNFSPTPARLTSPNWKWI